MEEIDGDSPLTRVREATNVLAMLCNKCRTLVTAVTLDPLFATTEFYMLQTSGSETVPEMSPLRHFEDQQSQDLVRGGRFSCRMLADCEPSDALFLLLGCFGAHGENRASAPDAGGETAASRQGCSQLGASAGLF